VMGPLAELKKHSSFGHLKGGRGLWGMMSVADAAVLRGLYPASRILEGAHTGKLSKLRDDSSEKKRRKERGEAAATAAPKSEEPKRETKRRTPWRRTQRKESP
jgi:hypothetical protein